MNTKGKLAGIGLDSDNSIVISSGILEALGIRKSNDIDITVDLDTYKRLLGTNLFTITETHGREIITAGEFEVGTTWFVLGKAHTLEELKHHSVVIDGVRYIKLEYLLAVKRSWVEEDEEVRQKDVDDVELIESYLANP